MFKHQLEDCKENANREVTKYDILLKNTSDADFEISFTCEKCQLRITEEVKPWEEYSVRVRAVNEVGYGPWSEPEVIVIMNQSPPTQPQLKDVSYDTTDCSSLCLKIMRNELQIKQQVTHCILEQSITNESSCYLFPETNKALNMVMRIPPGCEQCKYCIKFKNQWGESIPTEELDACAIIPSLIPGKPRKVRSIDAAKTSTEVWITWKQPKRNAGAVRRYIVEKRQLGAPWEEVYVPPETGMDPLESQLRDLTSHPPEHANQLYRQTATQKVAYRVVKNLKQDTSYEFRIFAENEKSQTGPPSTTLHVKTEPNKAAKVIVKFIEILRHFLNNYPKSPSRIVQKAWDCVSKEELPPPPEIPNRESDSDSDSGEDEDENKETKDL
jgi:hypothetical protein